MLLGHGCIPCCCIVGAAPSVVNRTGQGRAGRDEDRRPLLSETVCKALCILATDLYVQNFLAKLTRNENDINSAL